MSGAEEVIILYDSDMLPSDINPNKKARILENILFICFIAIVVDSYFSIL